MGADYAAPMDFGKSTSMRFAAPLLAVLFSVSACAQVDVHALARKVDAHYNHISSLRTSFTEHYTGMGLNRTEHGILLLRRPGRMRWNYSNGKVFVLDAKYAVSYVPGEPQAQRVPAKQLDDIRSPLRFLLGHAQIEKELEHLTASEGPNGSIALAGAPRYSIGSGENRLQEISIRVIPVSGAIVSLRIREVDGTVTEFEFDNMQENVEVNDADFRFTPPAGISIVEGLPPV